MRITLLANRDLPSNYALNLLLPRLAKDHSCALFLSDKVGGEAAQHPDLQRLQFLEQTLCNDLLFPPLDRLDATGELLTFSGLGTWLQQPWRRLNDPNSEAGLSALSATRPDVVMSLRYGRILQPEAINIPLQGVLNLHSGRLPKYRGVMATFRAMVAADTQLGTTLHWIEDASIDTGRIVNTQSAPLDQRRCYLSNVLSLYDLSCASVIDAIDAISIHQDLESSQAEGPSDYFSFPSAPDLAAFQANGGIWADLDFLAATLQRYQPPAWDGTQLDVSKAGLAALYRTALNPEAAHCRS